MMMILGCCRVVKDARINKAHHGVVMGDSVVVQGKKSTAELEAYVIMEVAIGEEGGGG